VGSDLAVGVVVVPLWPRARDGGTTGVDVVVTALRPRARGGGTTGVGVVVVPSGLRPVAKVTPALV